MVFDPKRFAAPATTGGSPPELRSPRGDEDIRVHPTWRYPDIAMAKASGKFYIVDQDLHGILSGRMFTCELRAAISAAGSIFVWPIKVDDQAQKAAAEKAVSEWLRVTWNTNGKTHEAQAASGPHDEPDWKIPSLDTLLEVVLVGRILTNPDSETVKAILAKKKRTRK